MFLYKNGKSLKVIVAADVKGFYTHTHTGEVYFHPNIKRPKYSEIDGLYLIFLSLLQK